MGASCLDVGWFLGSFGKIGRSWRSEIRSLKINIVGCVCACCASRFRSIMSGDGPRKTKEFRFCFGKQSRDWTSRNATTCVGRGPGISEKSRGRPWRVFDVILASECLMPQRRSGTALKCFLCGSSSGRLMPGRGMGTSLKRLLCDSCTWAPHAWTRVGHNFEAFSL